MVDFKMELPDDVLALIRDFSRPLTRSDWRTLRKMTNLDFHLALAREMNFTCPKVIYRLIISPKTELVYDLQFKTAPYIEYVYNLDTCEKYYVTPKYVHIYI
jgi:hypothetical protein